MAKTIPFNIKLTIDGKEVVVKCKRDVNQLADALTGAEGKTNKLKDAFSRLSNITKVSHPQKKVVKITVSQKKVVPLWCTSI